jgi:hypothetical protein
MFLLGGLLGVLLLVALVVLWSAVVESLSSGPITGRISGGLVGLAIVGVGLNLLVYSTGRSTPLTGTTGPVAPSKVRAVIACVFVLVGLAVISWAVVAQDTAGGF